MTAENRVDFYRGEEEGLAVSAGSLCVFIDGRVEPGIEVKRIVRASWPGFGRAILAVNAAEDKGTGEDYFGIGRRVRIERFFEKVAQPGGIFGDVIFAGQVEEVGRKIGKGGEEIEIIARDISAIMERVTVYGRWVPGAEGGAIFLSGAETVFNEDGKPNGAATVTAHNGRDVRLFCTDQGSERRWSYAEVIEYLLGMYLPAGVLGGVNRQKIEALTGGREAYDLDVGGLSLLEAIERCCEMTGLRFKFTVCKGAAEAEQAIYFYRSGSGREVELNLQPAGEGLCISKTDIAEFESRRYPAVTRRYIGMGDYKIFEGTFELVKVWDLSLEGTHYDVFSPSSNPEFFKVRDVYRKWALNEAGDYSGQPFNAGSAYDFSELFGAANYAKKRRRFWPVLSCDENGTSYGYFLEVSYDGGEHWWQYPGAFDNLLDECAIWLSSDRLDMDTWIGALKGILRFRITASVVSDERLSCVVTDGPAGGVVPVAEQVMSLPGRFRYKKVGGCSIFAGRGAGAGVAGEVDDTAALMDLVRAKASANAVMIEEAVVRTLVLGADYDVGDVVKSSPESRKLLAGNSGRTFSVIERVEMDFAKQESELKIGRYRKVYV